MQRTEILQAVSIRLTVRFPFWTEVLYSMTPHELPSGNELGVETLATDGRNLYVCRDFFNKLSIDEKVGVVVHELCHKIFLHTTRRGSRDPKMWNYAADYAVNNLLKANNFVLPKGALIDPRFDNWTAERIYDELKNEAKQQQGGQGLNGDGVPGPAMPSGGFDLMEPQMGAAETERYEEGVKQLVERAAATAKAMGLMPAGIEAGIAKAYAPTKEPWYNHLHRYMQSLAIGEYNWARPNRRALLTHGVFAPLHYSEALGTIKVFVDTSGSCYDAAQQAHFATHLNAILAEAKPQRVLLYYFDARVYPGEEVEPGTMEIDLKPKGGGGTDFRPIFEQTENDGIVPDVCIILTDMMGAFPEREPQYPVIWADVYGQYEAPFGETIHVE
jgi:predicted metal-dependent peptidase